MAPKKPKAKVSAVKVNPANDPRVAGILAHAKATREAGQAIDLPNDLRDLSGLDLTGADLRYIWLNGSFDSKLAVNLSGADLTDAYLTGADLSYANLTGANLTGANLTGAKIESANLTRAVFANADLTGAVLADAKLNDANLTGAWLTGTNLYNADLTGANLTNAKLNGAKLNGADLSRAVLTGAVLTRADLRDADLRDAYLTDADLSGAYLRGAKLNRANFTGADLGNADFGNAVLEGADLTRADLEGAYLSGANLSAVWLIGANLEGANLSGAFLSYANLEDANLRGADLSYAFLDNAVLYNADLRDANLTDANLSGADLTKAKLTGVDLSKVKGLPRKGALKEQYKIEAPSSPDFERWFGQSVVVGDKKKPIIVYHGTARGGFTVFDPKKRDPHHNAFYFTDDAEVAETYTDNTKPRERPDPALTNDTVGLYRLYVRLVNPMVIEGNGKDWNNLSDPRAPGLHRTYELAAWAEENGYDGVIFRNIVDDGGKGHQSANSATVYAVFDPRAIKSATANNGNYDPDDPDIRHNPVIEPSSVATLVFDRQGRVLILRRGPTAPWMPGKWSLPGGTVDPGETLLQAAVREAVEETTLKVKRAHPLTVIEHKPGGWSAAFFVSYPGDWSGKVKLDYENDAFAWIAESDIPRYSFIPTVIRALRLGFKGLRK